MTHFKGTARVGDYEGGGRIPVYFRKAIHECLVGLQDGALVEFIIKPRQRSRNQNDFYWGVAVPLVQSMFKDKGQNISAGDAHEVIFGAVLGHTKHVTMPDGNIVEVRRSSTELTTAEWEDAMTLLRAWCAKEGYQLPHPNEGDL